MYRYEIIAVFFLTFIFLLSILRAERVLLYVLTEICNFLAMLWITKGGKIAKELVLTFRNSHSVKSQFNPHQQDYATHFQKRSQSTTTEAFRTHTGV